jgi:hypothetical protein
MDDTLTVSLQDGNIEISKKGFISLLDVGPVKQYADYETALSTGSINFAVLKELAFKADVPYPLFFAPFEQIRLQIRDYNAQIYSRIPSKKDFSLHSRGRLRIEDIKLIVKDISRKQIFLSRYVLPEATDNPFIGLIAKGVKEKQSVISLAETLRSHLGVNLEELRSGSKEKVVAYIANCAEQNNIFVSFSSHNYMPQRITGLDMSGICIKDSRFPFIFINTKDGEENPRIIEPAGRQTFTLVAMLVSIGMNKFIFNNKTKDTKAPYLNEVYSIVGEFLIPASDIAGETAETIEDLKNLSNRFKVTPSMCLYRLVELKQIDIPLATELRRRLKEDITRRKGTPRPAGEVTGYAKYNGTRFSREILIAERRRAITSEQMRNVLFRKGKKISHKLLRDYRTRFNV